jgi:hypothetical protein
MSTRISTQSLVFLAMLLTAPFPLAHAADPPADSSKKPSLKERQSHVKRWELKFDFDGAKEYVRQLHDLGAYLGVPDEQGKLVFIRDLTERPAKPSTEDLKKLDRIYFLDKDAKWAEEIAEELKLPFTPAMIVAAVPRTFEQDLLKLELEHAQKNGRKSVDEVEKTKFEIKFRDHKPIISVVEQREKK